MIPGATAALAVIIPVGPGDRAWRGLLDQLHWLPAASELRLVACSAEDIDQTALAAATALPVDRAWLLADRGRARQLNAGAAATRAAFLWFLHADTRIPAPQAVADAIAQALAAYPQALSWFDLAFCNDGPAATRLNALGAGLRSRWLGLPFGDQGFLLARRTFESLGGYDETLPSAEDHALVWTARRAGVRLHGTGVALSTSARRYAEQGWWRTTLRHLTLTWQQARRFARRAPSRS